MTYRAGEAAQVSRSEEDGAGKTDAKGTGARKDKRRSCRTYWK